MAGVKFPPYSNLKRVLAPPPKKEEENTDSCEFTQMGVPICRNGLLEWGGSLEHVAKAGWGGGLKLMIVTDTQKGLP